MESFYFELNDLWNDYNDTCLEILKKWTLVLMWIEKKREGISFFFHVFGSLKEAAILWIFLFHNRARLLKIKTSATPVF